MQKISKGEFFSLTFAGWHTDHFFQPFLDSDRSCTLPSPASPATSHSLSTSVLCFTALPRGCFSNFLHPAPRISFCSFTVSPRLFYRYCPDLLFTNLQPLWTLKDESLLSFLSTCRSALSSFSMSIDPSSPLMYTLFRLLSAISPCPLLSCKIRCLSVEFFVSFIFFVAFSPYLPLSYCPSFTAPPDKILQNYLEFELPSYKALPLLFGSWSCGIQPFFFGVLLHLPVSKAWVFFKL